MTLLPLLALGLCWVSFTGDLLAAAPSPAPSRIWSGLVFASSDSHPAQPPEHLRRYAGKLKDIFGYNQFQLVGEYSDRADAPNERLLTPGKDFALSVKSVPEAGGRHARVVLFQNHRRIAEFETHLSPDSPLFIRGPFYARGQLVIVLHIVDPSELAASPRAIAATAPPRHPSGALPISSLPALERKELQNQKAQERLSALPPRDTLLQPVEIHRNVDLHRPIQLSPMVQPDLTPGLRVGRDHGLNDAVRP